MLLSANKIICHQGLELLCNTVSIAKQWPSENCCEEAGIFGMIIDREVQGNAPRNWDHWGEDSEFALFY